MTPLAQAISGALLQFVWQGFLVSILVSAAAFLLRKRAPGVRYPIYCMAMLLLASLPVITAVQLYDPLSANKPGRAAITLTIRAVWNGSPSPLTLFLAKCLNACQPWILPVWLLGVAFLSLRLAWLGGRVASLRNSGGPAPAPILRAATTLANRMGMTRVLRVLVSGIPDGPSVVGWFRPAILLPAATILNLTPEQLEAILAHEIAHLRRYDDVVNIMQSVIETLLFYHPAVWWLSNRIRSERELCCDDLAVRASGDALCYARALTALEILRVQPVGPPVSFGLGATTSPLEYRIRRIVGEHAQDYLPSGLPGTLALALALACVAIYSSPANGSAPVRLARPAYPESARVNGIQGTVPVEVRIDDQGNVSHAKAIGGPRELRQAAVDSASTLHFTPDETASPQQVNVAFQLEKPELEKPAQTAPPAPAPLVAAPARAAGTGWRDKGESIIGLAANDEKDPTRQLELLNQWEQLYPVSELKAQRTLMTTHALLAVLSEAYGKTDPVILDAAKKAAQQLADRFDEYLDDSMKPATLTPEEWANTRKTSELQIHTVLAYIAQANRDDDTAEVELIKVLAIDPEQASASYQLGQTILSEINRTGDISRYPEAIRDLVRSLETEGTSALSPAAKLAAASTLDQCRALAAALAPEFQATVVRQLSANRILVNMGKVPAGDAILRFDATDIRGVRGAIRPGASIRFRGVVDSYSADSDVLIFVIRNPEDDIVVLPKTRQPKRIAFLARVFRGIFHFVRRLA